MDAVFGNLEELLHMLAEIAIMMFEFIGVGVVAISGIKGLINYLSKNPKTKLILAEGLSMGLEFKLGGEILRTVLVRDLSEIAIVGGIILLRLALTLLLHWGVKNEKKEEMEAGEGSAPA